VNHAQDARATISFETMTIGIVQIDHVNVVVSKSMEDEAKRFYGSVLGLKEIPKPVELQGRGGAWYQLGSVQLHLSAKVDADGPRKGHVCYTVADVASAEEQLHAAAIEIIPDDQPVAGQPRFFVRDPGGNLIEIAQAV
jgi:catechol 2,3-dioxygenase-like lactoylglutathione lyase family enzyme